MSSMQIQLYETGIRRLTASLVIKDEAMAENVNLPIMANYAALGISIEDVPKREHKYYQNAAGLYHFTDEPMYVISLDTLETIPFTIEALELHRGTRREYRTKGRYYEELVKTYPNQEALIKGILNPVDLDLAVSAPNYTILQYDSSEIQSQETNLIDRLQEFIYTVMKRWVVKDYGKVDAYYPAAQMAMLYVHIPKIIANIRLENCKTYKAHSFHIWNYLDSHGFLGEFKDYLLTSQALWLYMNIEWVYANIGKQSTFERLVEQILTKRDIPVAQYSTALDISNLGTDLYGTPYMKRTPLNLLDRVGDTPVDKTLGYVLEKQLDLARDNPLVSAKTETELTRTLQRDLVSSYPTKVYESEMVDLSKRLFITFEEALLENWMYLSAKGRYQALISVQNPRTSDIMSMSVKDAFVMWLYITNRTLGYTLTQVPDIVAHYVPNLVRPTVAELRDVTSPRYVTDAQLQFMVSETPRVPTIISTAAYYEYVKELHGALLLHRKFYGAQEHKDTRGQLEGVAQRLFPSVHCDFGIAPTNYESWFASNGWEVSDLNAIDNQILADDLLAIATGLNLFQTTDIAEIQKAMLRLMTRLSEYSSHYIATINEVPATIADFVNVRIGDRRTDLTRSSRQTIGVHVQDQFRHLTRSDKLDLVIRPDLNPINVTLRRNTDVRVPIDLNGSSIRRVPVKTIMGGTYFR